MPSYSYLAREAGTGREIRSSIDAATEQAAIAALLNRNLLVVSIQERIGRKGKTAAIKQAGVEVPFKDGYRVACIVGSGAGGLQTMELCYRDLFINKKRATHPLTLLRFIGSSAAAHVGIEYGIKGPTFATCSACSTAASASVISENIWHESERLLRN